MHIQTSHLRDAADVMSPERLGSLQPSGLSATRSLIRKMVRERWAVTREEFDVDPRARGTARYRVQVDATHSFEFVLFSFEPRVEERTDRIIGRNWDLMAALLEGSADPGRIEHTKVELPKLYGGRAAPGTLIWCRANRSMRAFDLTVDALARGEQPPVSVLASVCYLMRNTGLDGNGTFGTRSFLAYEPDHPLRVPYHAQMLTAYLMREFSFDLAEHLARCRAPQTAVGLDPDLRRFLGLGNGSGLGLALFAKNHPKMLDRWLGLRERALAHARTLDPAEADWDLLESLLARIALHRRQDRLRYTAGPDAISIAVELDGVLGHVRALRASGDATLEDVYAYAAGAVGYEAQEIVNALLIDLIGDPELDALAEELVIDETLAVQPTMPVGELSAAIADEYSWALDVDLTADGARHYAWYKSANAEEPRRGPVADLPSQVDDLTLDLPRDLQALVEELDAFDPTASVGAFLRAHPAERGLVARVQSLAGLRFHTVRCNMRDRDFNAAHVIRVFNAALYGLDKTKEDGPMSVIGVLFHGAPTPEDIARGVGADWAFPAEPQVAG